MPTAEQRGKKVPRKPVGFLIFHISQAFTFKLVALVFKFIMCFIL